MAHTSLHSSLLARRKALGLTQKELARLVQTTQQHISLIESGVHQPNLRTLQRIFAAVSWEMTPRPSSAGLAARLAGLSRFNVWESAQPSSVDAEQAFRQAGALAQWSGGTPLIEEDWQARARAWAQWRSRLPRRMR